MLKGCRWTVTWRGAHGRCVEGARSFRARPCTTLHQAPGAAIQNPISASPVSVFTEALFLCMIDCIIDHWGLSQPWAPPPWTWGWSSQVLSWSFWDRPYPLKPSRSHQLISLANRKSGFQGFSQKSRWQQVAPCYCESRNYSVSCSYILSSKVLISWH